MHGPEAGGLNGGAVGQGIGKGHAQFQDIGAPGGHLQGQGPGGGQIRVTRSDKGDEGLFALGLELFEHPVNARSPDTSIASATASTSLSPRPERLTITMSSAVYSGASRFR